MYYWKFLYDPSTFIMAACAVFTILYGCYRSLHFTHFASTDEADTSEVKMKTAIILPIVGSVFLILLFYFLKGIYYVLLVILSFASLTALSFVIYPASEWLCNHQKFRKYLQKSWEIKWIGAVDVAGIIAFLVALTFIIIWEIYRKDERVYYLTNVLAIALAITSLSSVRLPNLKISSIILGLFFVYDIFWVFLSSYIFKENVMITVAQGLPNLPMVVIFKRYFDDNNGYSMLGLGDIVLPGLFLCFLYRFDHYNKIQFKQGYFLRAWIGYIFGLYLTFVMLLVLQRGQPALLYLVPCTILPTLFFGWRRQQLTDLWKGLYRVDDLETGAGEPHTSVPHVKEEKKSEDLVSLLQHQEEQL